jgi:hypothetical protein
LNILVAHTQDSIPIDVNRPVGGPLAALVTNAVAYQHVVNLLDSARTSLASASTFPFDPGPGFAGFNTPATFIAFNRALMARIRVYQASPSAPGGPCVTCWDSALVALSQSFLNPAGSLDSGVYNVFSSGNQDLANALSQAPASAINLAHPMIKDSAETQAGGALDKRVLAKTTNRGTPFTLACLTSGLSWTRYPTPNSSIPIVRNEELILLRAEAEWFAAAANKPQAVSDINLIRRTSGGLAATTVTLVSSDSVFVNEVLKQRLYSLLYEGGHRWIDMRRRGRLSQVLIDRPTGCAAAIATPHFRPRTAGRSRASGGSVYACARIFPRFPRPLGCLAGSGFWRQHMGCVVPPVLNFVALFEGGSWKSACLFAYCCCRRSSAWLRRRRRSARSPGA